MLVMCGYNFCKDGDTLNPSPTSIENISSVKLENGYMYHWNATRDVTSEKEETISTMWDYFTIMDANFDNSIDAGNIQETLASIEGFKIKRRKVGEFDWVTLKYIPIEDTTELSFIFEDHLAQSGIEYEWAFVPIAGGIEGNYVTNTLKSKFNGVFICDLNSIYKFYAGAKYGTNTRVQKVGVFEPFGRKYPVIVSNGSISYETGSLTGTILPRNFEDDRKIDNLEIIKQKKELFDFLTNKKAKILKDYAGNCWLVMITNSPAINFKNDGYLSLGDMSVSWTEIGDANSQYDLYESGMIEEAE